MATGDVVLKLNPRGGFGDQADLALQGRLPHQPSPEALAARNAREDAEGQALHKAVDNERKAHAMVERAKESSSPLPDPWDAWRNQKAPDMFEEEVTHRG